MGYDLLNVPVGYKTDLALIIAPYFDSQFAEQLIETMKPRRLGFLLDDGASKEDVRRLLEKCGKRNVKIALGAAAGIVHIKGFYLEFVKPSGRARRKRKFIFGSGNATEAAFGEQVIDPLSGGFAMPNPYLPYFHDKRYSLGFDALNSRPKFEAATGRCIGIWSYVDEAVGSLFGILLGTESDAARRVFFILRRWTNQRQALDAAAEGVLSGDKLTAYRALMSEYELKSRRNDLGHGCFGFCPDDVCSS